MSTPAATVLPTRANAFSLAVLGAFVLTSALAILGICVVLLTGRAAASHDYISYWATGQQLAHHADPYDAQAILSLERSAGFPKDTDVLLMRNPPPALLLTLPLGFIGAKVGSVLWSLLLAGCLACSVWLLWLIRDRPLDRRMDRPTDRLCLLGFCFAPALASLATGQTGILCLFGLALFLYFVRSIPFVAGAALWFCALKPHLFLPFAAALLAWIILRRAYAVLLGAGFALGTSIAIATHFDPALWTHYAQMMHGSRIDREFIPTLSLLLRLSIDRHALWLQSLPAIAGSIWALRYLWLHREEWDWNAHGGLLIIVSMMVAPYAWFTDQAMLLPAILGLLTLERPRMLTCFLGLNSIMLGEILCGFSMHSALYLWTAPAWLGWSLHWPTGYGTSSRARTCRAGRLHSALSEWASKRWCR